MKILIFGKNGQLGQEICKITRPIFETIELNSDECNFSDDDNIHKTILFFKPDIIINCSAYTKVDLAEKEKAFITTLEVKEDPNADESSEQS